MSGHCIVIMEPQPYQVIQRHGYDPVRAHWNNPGGPCLGQGVVTISGYTTDSIPSAVEARTVLLQHAYGKSLDWRPLNVNWEGTSFTACLEIPAGGWYRVELRYTSGDGEALHCASVEPVGVGEVFLIAGQSYAENCNDEYTYIEDLEGRVAVFDLLLQEWRVAHDPQPNVMERNDREGRFKGTIWPTAMNLLLPLIGVPIGMVNVAVGSTSVSKWMPGESLFENLFKAGGCVHDFRCILWQQGESDVIEETPKDVYISRLIEIKAALEQRCGFSRFWLPAKSTYHPMVYIEPEREGWIRSAMDELWRLPGFMPGPDTDILGGIGLHRADRQTSAHFTLLGQKRAGLMWCIALWNMLQTK